jgi:indolepyruvate ferredoxin oxidoreductase
MLREVSLEERFDLSAEMVQLTGAQAVVRLALMQHARDRSSGLNTAGYITGYRGSPLGGLDQQFLQARAVLDANDIVFNPGLNEDLAATALWGAQQAEMRGDGRFDGVFGLWYGKGPGVDRSGDVLRHANLAGSSPKGGVIALMGDDHTCESSTTAHQSEFAFVDAMIPILSPAGVQEILDFGLHGWALSRFAGTWCGIKCVKDTIESTATVDGRLDRVRLSPVDFAGPPEGLNIRPNDHPNTQEARLHDYKIKAALAYLRANRLNQIVISGGARPRIGIVAAGKSYLDVRQALDDLGIDEIRATSLGIRTFKIGAPWPLEPTGIREFADGLELIIVVEEKRSLIESQIKDILYGMANCPVVVGKHDETGGDLFTAKGALDALDIAVAIGERVLRLGAAPDVESRLSRLRANQATLRAMHDVATRTPYFCAGCPHNSSTIVPEGSRAYAGIGCHYMAQSMDRSTEGYSQMGGEGANWIGEARFSKRGHIFQNMGDGTYNHSGYLAVRAAKAAGVNITFKILFNDAVAMTGGQRHEGGLTADAIARQVAAEGAARIEVVTDEPNKYPAGIRWPEGTHIHHRSALDTVQKALREVPGLTVIIYDQTCAAEKRRRRKRGGMVDPDVRVFINDLVCEGCGDCGVKSNCVAVVPLETEFGRKRAIDQSACNKDLSCVQGFCPSFVTVSGGKMKRGKPSVAAGAVAALPDPVTGVGGTGVVTVGALIAMAAHLEGKGCGVIDMAGLAQKGGAVVSHLKLAARQEDISAIRVSPGGADLLIACDIVVAGTRQILAAIADDRTTTVLNTYQQFPGSFTKDPDLTLPVGPIEQAVKARSKPGAFHAVDATQLATAWLGDAILANVFMLGFAYQAGGLPLSAEALERAIALNGAAVEANVKAFRLGRQAALPGATVEAAPKLASTEPVSVEAFVARRAAFLKDYQSARYAGRYRRIVDGVRQAEARVAPGSERLTGAVASSLFKLMAYKDEYEVARLHTDTGFLDDLKGKFDGEVRTTFHLAPPFLSRPDPVSGEARKRPVGPWIVPVFRVLARLKPLRGTPLDPFGWSGERRMERRLIREYQATVKELLERLTPDNLARAATIAALPERMRGYGHVKRRNVEAVKLEEARLMKQFREGGRASPAAAGAPSRAASMVTS